MFRCEIWRRATLRGSQTRHRTRSWQTWCFWTSAAVCCHWGHSLVEHWTSTTRVYSFCRVDLISSTQRANDSSDATSPFNLRRVNAAGWSASFCLHDQTLENTSTSGRNNYTCWNGGVGFGVWRPGSEAQQLSLFCRNCKLLRLNLARHQTTNRLTELL